MTERSADRHEQYAAAVMRRLVDAHAGGQLTTAAYRKRRRRLLEAITAGRPVPRRALPPETPGTARAALWPRAALLVVVVVLLAAIWWLRG